MEQSPSWKASCPQVVKKCPVFYRTQRLIAAHPSGRAVKTGGVCNHSLAGTAGSITAGGMDVLSFLNVNVYFNVVHRIY